MTVSKFVRTHIAIALFAVATAALATASPVRAGPIDAAVSRTAGAPNCGPDVARAGGGVWKCTFADNFSGKVLDTTKWSALTTAATGTGKPECRVNNRNNISVARGVLRLTVRKKKQLFVCHSLNGDFITQYTAGAVTTYSKFSQTYGRFAIRARFPATKVLGLHSALWLWPQELTYGDASGEIDIAEFRTGLPNRVVPTLHDVQASSDSKVENYSCYIGHPEDFHLYVLEWTPESITIKYDGKVCLYNDNWRPVAPLVNPAPFDQPFRIILNQSLGSGLNAFIPALTPLPATTRVDYVRVWS